MPKNWKLQKIKYIGEKNAKYKYKQKRLFHNNDNLYDYNKYKFFNNIKVEDKTSGYSSHIF